MTISYQPLFKIFEDEGIVLKKFSEDMRKIVTVLILLCSVFFISLTASAEDNWIYAGRFGLLWKPPVAHNVDMFLVNHLTTFRGNTNSSDPEAQLPFDVYYKHDHSTDTGNENSEADLRSYRFQVKIVPLNIKGTTMGPGYYGGTIVCDYRVSG